MKNKTAYLIPILSVLILIVVSSCRGTNDDLAYYYNNNGSGNGNSCCGCCGCNNNNTDTSDLAIPYCEPDPEQRETRFCEDGTIRIDAYKGVNFGTFDEGVCGVGSGTYMAVRGGYFHLAGVSGRELWNADDKPLYFSSGSVAEIPDTIESVVILPDGSVVGYINGVGSTLGKLLIVNTSNIGTCASPVSPSGLIDKSILYCGERVCATITSGSKGERIFEAVPLLARINMTVPSGAFLMLNQKEIVIDTKDKILASGFVRAAVRLDGALVESRSCLPLVSGDGIKTPDTIAIPIGITELAIKSTGAVIINGEDSVPWANVAIVVPENSKEIARAESITGLYKPIKEGTDFAVVAVTRPLDVSGTTEVNTCTADDSMAGLLEYNNIR